MTNLTKRVTVELTVDSCPIFSQGRHSEVEVRLVISGYFTKTQHHFIIFLFAFTFHVRSLRLKSNLDKFVNEVADDIGNQNNHKEIVMIKRPTNLDKLIEENFREG